MDTIVEFYIAKEERKKAIRKLLKYITLEKNCILAEKGIYYFTKQFCLSNGNILHMARSIYIDKYQDLFFNLKRNNRTIKKIIKDIENNNYNPYNLAFLSSDELDEDNWMKIILHKHTTEDKLKNLPTIEWKPCRNCKKKEYFYYQLQTRSADEPMTTFYICKNCDKTYKVNN